ncbi:protein BTG4 [Lissotriton helveticus]
MKDEIAATVVFFTRLAKKHEKMSKQKIERFAVNLTSILFAKYRNHWYLENPSKGQAFRCIRINKQQSTDLMLQRACAESSVNFSDLGLPAEMTIWVDPFEVSCRYGEKSRPFTVAHFDGGVTNEFSKFEISRCIGVAVEKSTFDYSAISSDEETSIKEPKTIPTVSNPNSIYQSGDYSHHTSPVWSQFSRKKVHPSDGYHPHKQGFYPPAKGFKPYRPSAAFTGPRVDRYHWVNTKR